ncbi:MAG: hypothetical protein NC489_08370 [Ruminococcus flavefaciens]|nr:hypothetical protein [Ruminococcus flavefaciens]
MANLNDETKKNLGEEAPVAPEFIGKDPAAMTDPELIDAVKHTTGIDFGSEMVYRNDAERKLGQTPANYEEADAEEDAGSPPSPTATEKIPEDPPVVPGGSMFLTPEEAAKLGINTENGTQLDPEEAYRENVQKKVDQLRNAEREGYEKMESEAVRAEEERMKRLEATLSLPDDHPDKQKLLGDRKQMVADAQLDDTERRQADRTLEGVSGYDPEMLVPSYEMSDEEEDAATPKAEDKADPIPGDDDYGEFVRSLPLEHYIPTKTPVVTTKREPTVVEKVDDWNKKKNSQPLGDQAFFNAVAKFKKNNFGVKTIPLVNSGFFVDIVGSGVVDMQNMYMNVDKNTRMYDYQMEQMRVLIQNIVGTSPKINPNVLRDKIHYEDFDMIAYGHICATLDKVESVANCTECGKAFRMNGAPGELLLNMDELAEKAAQIRAADSIESVSLLSKYRVVNCVNGMTVTLGHPSYANGLGILNSFAAYYNNLPPLEANRFNSLLGTMRMIRKITLPNGIHTNSLLQIYEAIKLMTQEDLELVQHEISKMRKDVLKPKFGVREVRCPHCGKIVKNVEYEDLMNMLFFHTQLSGLLNEPMVQQ